MRKHMKNTDRALTKYVRTCESSKQFGEVKYIKLTLYTFINAVLYVKANGMPNNNLPHTKTSIMML
jgi:hypothetical protein